VRDALDNDKEYQNLKTQLKHKAPIIPTIELSQNIIEYNKMAILRCAYSLMALTDDKKVLDVIPISYQLDAKIDKEKIDDQLMKMLARVNQSIDNYYTGNTQKDEGEKRRK